MDKAVQRIAKAIFNREKICIYGDYDVDGITSTSLLYLFLKELNANVTYYVPNRLEEGYGLNKEAIDEICQKKINLMITVDCGITAVDEVAYAVDKGIDIIITDHHQQGERLPLKACAIVNPMRMDDTYPFKYLSGVGVAFKLVMALRYFLQNSPEYKFSLPNIKKYLDIVTLGTIADVVPLVGENRIFVKHGLKMLSEKSSRVGLEELKKITGLVNVSLNASHIGFVLAPRINAVGRMGCSDRGVRLLITEDKNEARWLAEELDMENRYRQGIEKTILAESYAKIERHRLHEKYRGIVLYSEDWHPGVIGIVASRVVEKYFRPTIVITMENGLGKGSARSIPAFHLYDGLKDISDLLVSFGGHKYAAGLKVEAENIKMLQKEFHKIISSQLNDEDFIPEINIDAIVEDSQINDELVQWLNKMRPFGSGNSEPVFLMKGLRKFQQFFYIGKDKKHIKGFLEKNGRVFQVIGYNMPEYEKILKNNEIFDIAFVPEYNTWLGEKTIQLKLKDIREAQ
jgi:single-stranded-DNA-specific exonuclease